MCRSENLPGILAWARGKSIQTSLTWAYEESIRQKRDRRFDRAAMEKEYQPGLVLPDMVNICIDGLDGPEITGRLYACGLEVQPFGNAHELLRRMTGVMDGLDYPQPAMSRRTYRPDPHERKRRPARPHNPSAEEAQRIMGQRGKLATAAVYVKYRQNATWQGTVLHVESGERRDFQSELEFLKIMDRLTDVCKAPAF